MIRHLTAADFVTMPWANGLGRTVEMIRRDGPHGMLWRLSRASVVADGAFSSFPGIERNLTVISGPGFDLRGEGVSLRAAPLVPVRFAGDVAIAAVGVTAPSDDFNVMTARSLPLPEVVVVQREAEFGPGGTLCVFALGVVRVGSAELQKHDLLIIDAALQVSGLSVVVRLPG